MFLRSPAEQATQDLAKPTCYKAKHDMLVLSLKPPAQPFPVNTHDLRDAPLDLPDGILGHGRDLLRDGERLGPAKSFLPMFDRAHTLAI